MKINPLTHVSLAFFVAAACSPTANGGVHPDSTDPEAPAAHGAHHDAEDAPHQADNQHGQDEHQSPSDHQGVTEAGPPAKGPDIVPDELRSHLAKFLPLYDGMRSALARDDANKLQTPAKKLVDHIGHTKAKAPPDLRKHLEAIERVAVTMASTHTDLEAARMLFGELSRPVVELLSRSPSLAHGQHLFTCPMAKGYQKWIQPTAELKNPYMGTKMLGCGSEIPWTDSPTKG